MVSKRGKKWLSKSVQLSTDISSNITRSEDKKLLITSASFKPVIRNQKEKRKTIKMKTEECLIIE